MRVALLAAALALAGSAYAEAPRSDERKAKAREMQAKAAKACESSKGKDAEYRACMRRELCAQTKDPAKCEANVKEAVQRREKAREACKDMKGDEQRACLREQRAKK